MFEIFRCYKLPNSLFQHVNYNKQPFTFTNSTKVHFSNIISGIYDIWSLLFYYLFILIFIHLLHLFVFHFLLVFSTFSVWVFSFFFTIVLSFFSSWISSLTYPTSLRLKVLIAVIVVVLWYNQQIFTTRLC
jgi:hypothetical protein